MNEHGLRKSVTAYFKALGPDVFMEKRWGGGFFHKTGVVDYVGVAWGIAVAIELKHPDKPAVVLDEAQVVFLQRFERAGGLTLATNRLQDVKNFMARVRLRARGHDVRQTTHA